jgi:hypothetical protein
MIVDPGQGEHENRVGTLAVNAYVCPGAGELIDTLGPASV